MQKYRRFTYPLLFILLVSTLITVVAAIQHQNKPVSEQEMTEAEPPLVDFAAPEPSDADARARHKAKGKRYDKGRPEKVEELPDDITPLPLIVHWWSGLPALPAAQSDAVVLGEITDAQAQLSSDKTGVYSEFTIHIDELLKNDSQSSLAAGNTVIAERPGGRVKFRSGKVQQYSIDKQGMPRAGGRYVFFLKSNGEGQDFSIITGYELRNGLAYPLDGARSGNRGTGLPFDAYKGSDEITFLNAVRDAIAAQGGKNQ